MTIQLLDLTEQVDGITDIFVLPTEALQLLDGLDFHVLRSGQKIHKSQVTVLSPTSFQLNFIPKKDRDVIEVLYDDVSASLTINCGGITNHILPIKGEIIDGLTINGALQQEITVQGCIPFLGQIDGNLVHLVELQASAVSEQQIFGVVDKC